ncbi:MAG: hypothetical protein ACYCSN_12460 [Acidobacteriaceae bacterium]
MTKSQIVHARLAEAEAAVFTALPGATASEKLRGLINNTQRQSAMIAAILAQSQQVSQKLDHLSAAMPTQTSALSEAEFRAALWKITNLISAVMDGIQNPQKIVSENYRQTAYQFGQQIRNGEY